MKKPVLKFKKLTPEAIIPSYAYPDDAAFDLYSTEGKILDAGARHTFKTGLASEIPEGWWVSIRDRSGLASKAGLHTMAGVIDAGYRGEWGVILVNLGKESQTIEKGERIAQGIFEKVVQPEIVEVEELSETHRGQGGFGSTGRK